MFSRIGFTRRDGWHKPLVKDDAPILDGELFKRSIARERSRSDRNSHGFCLVAFRTPPINSKGRERDRLLRTLSSRIRLTDELGWMDKDEIGVLLPDTHPAGARKFSDYVRVTMADKDGYVPECRVYSYPERLTQELDGPRDVKGQLFLDGVDAGPDLEQMASVPDPVPEPAECEEPELPAEAAAHAAAHADDLDKWDSSRADGLVNDVLPETVPFWKRVIDVVGASVALIVFSPIMLAQALLIKMVSPGPILFKQERVGHMGRRFMCFKFRTMHVDTDVAGHKNYFSSLIKSNTPMTKLDKGADPRVIPLGRTLRQLGLDELPQLFNVLKGEMSLIGPRPCIPYEYEDYSRWHRQRVLAQPGLTGLWQVSGKNHTTFEEMMRLDIAYGRIRNPLLDLAIVFKTVPAILSQAMESFFSRD